MDSGYLWVVRTKRTAVSSVIKCDSPSRQVNKESITDAATMTYAAMQVWQEAGMGCGSHSSDTEATRWTPALCVCMNVYMCAWVCVCVLKGGRCRHQWPEASSPPCVGFLTPSGAVHLCCCLIDAMGSHIAITGFAWVTASAI